MDLSLNEFSMLMVKRSDRRDLFDGLQDIRTLNILMMLDQPKSIETATQEVGYKVEDMKDQLESLIKDGSLKVVDGKGIILDISFINYLEEQLTRAVGPLAAMLLEDVAWDLGYDINYFPLSQAASLCGLLAKEIKRDDLAIEFKRNVADKLRTHQL